MAFSSSVRLFATASLLVMLLIASEMGAAASLIKCLRKNLKLEELCLPLNPKCNEVCKSDGFAKGICIHFMCTCITGSC
ncbi:PREDICTED: defensin J1-1-like [Ipomoea nil]|uniref:defensin J1-1-like n=1 Tax=Ipomoea nil TaxID=35883 RepID=UPI0009008A24|nr:PREDICTED: defensin J1-1-like [Ipomoea nil]